MDIIGDTVLTHDGHLCTLSSYAQPHALILAYCSASWCRPCKAFTPRLADICVAFPHVQVVFVSLDRSERAFAAYFQSMPSSWVALPFDAARAADVFAALGGTSIPCCVMVRDANGTFRRGSIHTQLLTSAQQILAPAAAAAPQPLTPADESSPIRSHLPMRTFIQVLQHPHMHVVRAATGACETMSAAFIFLLFCDTLAPETHEFINKLGRWLRADAQSMYDVDVLFVPLEASPAREVLRTMPWFMVEPACLIEGMLASKRLAQIVHLGEQLPSPALILLDARGQIITRDGIRRLAHESTSFPWISMPAPRRVIRLETELGLDVYGCAWAFVLFLNGQTPPAAITTAFTELPLKLKVNMERVRFCISDAPSALSDALCACIDEDVARTTTRRVFLAAFSFPTQTAYMYTARASMHQFVLDVLQGKRDSDSLKSRELLSREL